MHGGVRLRMSDRKLVAPWTLDWVRMGWGRVSSRSPVSSTPSVQEALVHFYLCNQGRWQMPCSVVKWIWRREGFAADGFLDIWGLSSSQLWKRWATPWSGADVGLIARTGSEVLGWCPWGSCGSSAGGLAPCSLGFSGFDEAIVCGSMTTME